VVEHIMDVSGWLVGCLARVGRVAVRKAFGSRAARTPATLDTAAPIGFINSGAALTPPCVLMDESAEPVWRRTALWCWGEWNDLRCGLGRPQAGRPIMEGKGPLPAVD
jgi:hypothetical protein